MGKFTDKANDAASEAIVKAKADDRRTTDNLKLATEGFLQRSRGKPSMAFNHDQDVGTKWKVHRGRRASAA